MDYFIQYVLGWSQPPNIKTDKGTITHKILEVLAQIKLAQQLNQENIINDICGKIDTQKFDISTICEQVFHHYSTRKSTHVWTATDFRDCCNWVKKVLNFNDGAFNPLKMNIVSTEQAFDITITEPWAWYEYEFSNRKISGYLALKGTIDLVTSPSTNVYEIIDWKTGRRLNWATGEEKTHEKLSQDPQLMMYFLAASKLYPTIDNILTTIMFINDGGPYSLCFPKEYVAQTLEMLKKRFEEIKNMTIPTLNPTWKCKKLCFFGKSTFDNSSISPIIEFRGGQVCSKGQKMTKCQQIAFDIERKGIDAVIKNYTIEGYNIDNYNNPGE